MKRHSHVPYTYAGLIIALVKMHQDKSLKINVRFIP